MKNNHFPFIAASKFVEMTTFGTASDKNVASMMTFLF